MMDAGKLTFLVFSDPAEAVRNSLFSLHKPETICWPKFREIFEPEPVLRGQTFRGNVGAGVTFPPRFFAVIK